MKFIKPTPTIRVSLGLVFLTVSIMFTGELIGIMPDSTDVSLDARKKLCESLAVQFSSMAHKDHVVSFGNTLKALVERNEDVLSAGMRSFNGRLLADSGNHQAEWLKLDPEKSNPNFVQVPIYRNNQRWATVEVRFSPLWTDSIFDILENSFVGMTLFVAACGFVGYFFFMKRTLRELDPSAVVPERVRAAFDALAEGVIIIDEKEHIVLANAAFSNKIGVSVQKLIGLRISELKWAPGNSSSLPWTRAMQTGHGETGVSLSLETDDGTLTLMANIAPISDGKSRNRGILVTFDDVTKLEKRNHQLKVMVGQITKKNEELHYLATRDPMTGCLNRRSFYEGFELLFNKSRGEGLDLTCIMADIDHFKLVNDNYGHSVGDDVIKLVADIYKEFGGEEDLVGRYGGEEFCLVFPANTIDQTAEIAERMRLRIKDESIEQFPQGPHITSSFGVSTITSGAENYDALCNQADEALYFSKENGRNRVTMWSPDHSTKQQPLVAPATPEQLALIADEPSEAVSAGAPPNANSDESKLAALVAAHQEITLDPPSVDVQDSLTGLPSVVLFRDRIEQALRRAERESESVAMLWLGINMVKNVNHSLGHLAGDQVLKAVVDRLSSILRSTDALAKMDDALDSPAISRINGDEFAILLTELKSEEDVTWIVKRIFEKLALPFAVEKQDHYLSGNIGISLYPQDGKTADELLKNASIAQDYAKNQKGHNKFQFYTQEINAISSKQLKLENELHRAVGSEEFVLHYQPKVDIHSGEIIGLEALIRWNHPTMGMIPPTDFIPLCEQSGLIVELGEWVLKTAFRQMRRWLDDDVFFGRIGVNMSAVQLRQKNIAERVIILLNEAGVDPQRLDIEITETILVENLEGAIAALTTLHDLGVTISIDDFGTGYASLNYLKHFPVDTLKIDRSFLSKVNVSPHDARIVSSITAIAQNMRLNVVAEGVESFAHLAFLQGLGCKQVQGALFSMPVSVEEVTELLVSTPSYRLSPPKQKEFTPRLVSGSS